MYQIKTNSSDLIVVEIPEDTTWWQIIENECGNFITKTLDLPEQFLQYGKKSIIFGKEVINQMYYNPENFYLPKGKHKILGKLSELSEEECSRFVEVKSKHPNKIIYKDYTDYSKGQHVSMVIFITSAKESLISLLQSNGIDTNKNLLLIEVL